MKKKLISVLLMTTMAAALLTGCGDSDRSASAEEPVNDAAEEPVNDAAEELEEEPGGESFKGSLEGVTLAVGTSGTYAPFSYFAEDGTTLQGYDVDFLNAL